MIPIIKTYYCNTASFQGTAFGEMTEVAPPTTFTALGWNTGRNNPPLFCEMNWNLKVPRTSSQWQASPTQSIPSQNAGGNGAGNCWIMGPLNGEFNAGIWQITMSVSPISAGQSHDGQFIYRIWTSPYSDGQSATLITSSFLSSSLIIIPTGTFNASSGSASINLPHMNFHNDYLLFQTYWSIINTSTNTLSDTNFVLGPTSSLIVTAPFIENRATAIMWEQSDL